MSKCTNCSGTGKVPCRTCHGVGFSSRTDEDGETINRLCSFCGGERKIRCGFCRGTGEVAAVHESAPPPQTVNRPRPAPVDRLAGRWKGVEGTWVEFTPDANGYRTTAGGMRGITGCGTATLLGSKVTLDATDQLCGHYTLELNLRGNHLDGIDRKAGYPIPVEFTRA